MTKEQAQKILDFATCECMIYYKGDRICDVVKQNNETQLLIDGSTGRYEPILELDFDDLSFYKEVEL